MNCFCLLVNRDGKDITVIGIEADFDSDDSFGSIDIEKDVDSVVKEVMSRK